MERDHLEGLEINGKIILKWILWCGIGAWTRLIRLRIGTGGKLL